MNNSEYKEAFSGVRHSEALTERILDMTKEKRRSSYVCRGLICAVTVIAILVCGALTANAATDGAVAEYVSEKTEKITENIRFFIGGREIPKENIEYESSVTPDGEKKDHCKIELGDDSYAEYYISSDEEGNAVEVLYAGNAENIDSEAELEICDPTEEVHIFDEPTTSQAQ